MGDYAANSCWCAGCDFFDQHVECAAGGESSGDGGLGEWIGGEKRVAGAMMGFVAKAGVRFDGALLAGDNFYGALGSTNDGRWKTDFENEYDVKALDFPFFATAGNHDYEGRKLYIEMDYSLQNPHSRWKFPPMVPGGFASGEDAAGDGLMLDSNKDRLTADWGAEVKWIDYQLADVERVRKLRHESETLDDCGGALSGFFQWAARGHWAAADCVGRDF